MRTANFIAWALVATVCAASAGAAPLVDEFYSYQTSRDNGYAALNAGRWSESYYGGSEGAVGNRLNSASWDGSSLGAEWVISDMRVLSRSYDGNSGPDAFGGITHYYTTVYDPNDASMLLKDAGPWWNPADGASGSYAVDVTDYVHYTDVYVDSDGNTQAVSNHVSCVGTFEPAYPGYQLEFLLAIAERVGEGAAGDMPADYPAMLPDDPYTGDGHWGVVQSIDLEITPEPASMALVGLGGVALLLRRRRRRR